MTDTLKLIYQVIRMFLVNYLMSITRDREQYIPQETDYEDYYVTRIGWINVSFCLSLSLSWHKYS